MEQVAGFGKSTVMLFLRHGAKVIIADIQDDLGQSIYENQEDVTYVHCNVITSDTDMKNMIDIAMSKYGTLAIMFNNAGVGDNMDPTILGSDNENFKKVFDINVYGAFLGAKHAARFMIPAKKGVIIFTSSATSVTSCGLPHAYTMSKHALVGLTKNLYVELGQYGIIVNCISPFAISTPLLTSSLGLEKSKLDGLICDSGNLKGVVPKEDNVAEAVLFLVNEGSKFVSGLNLVVDGGYSTTNPSFTMVTKDLISG